MYSALLQIKNQTSSDPEHTAIAELLFQEAARGESAPDELHETKERHEAVSDCQKSDRKNAVGG